LDIVNRINREKKYITLKFFPETKALFDGVVSRAVGIIQNKYPLDYSRRAIFQLCEDSRSASDVYAKEATILKALEQSQIEQDNLDYSNILNNRRYILYGTTEYDKFKSEHAKLFSNKSDNKLDYYIKILTIIRGKRGSFGPEFIEKSRAIFVTGSSLGLELSKDCSAQNNFHIHLAYNMETILSLLWLKTFRTLGNQNIPQSLNLVSRCCAVLNEDLQEKTRKRLEELKSSNYDEKAKENILAHTVSDLKKVEKFLDNINTETDFPEAEFDRFNINTLAETIERHRQMEEDAVKAQRMEEEVGNLRQEVESAKEEARVSKEKQLASEQILSKYKEEQEEKEYNSWLKKQKRKVKFKRLVFWFCLAIINAILCYIIYKANGYNGAWGWILSIVTAIVSVTFPLYGPLKKFYRKISRIPNKNEYKDIMLKKN